VVALSSAGAVTVQRLDEPDSVRTLVAASDGSDAEPPPQALSEDGRFVARWDVDSSHIILTQLARTPIAPRDLEKLTAVPSVLAFDPGGKFLAAAETDETIVWSTTSGDRVSRISLPKLYDVDGLAVDPKGRYLAVHDTNGEASLWDTTKNTLITVLTREGTGALAFSPSGQWLGVGTQVDTRIWDMRDVEATPERIPEGATLGATKFSPDGKYIAVAAQPEFYLNGEISVWQIDNKQLIGTSRAPNGDFAFMADDRHLLVANPGVRVEPFLPSTALDKVCSVTGNRNLTRGEWGQYAPGFDYIHTC
jgi:WD40 repeat protein